MLRHAARAVPWTLLVVVAAVLAALVRTVAEWPWQVWPLQGIAVGLLAAAVTYAFDEPAAELVDTLPRALWWRTTARSSAGVLLVAVVGVACLGGGRRLVRPPVGRGGPGRGGGARAVAGVTALRRRGRATPAAASSSAIITVTVFVSLARPWGATAAPVPLHPDGAVAGERLVVDRDHRRLRASLVASLVGGPRRVVPTLERFGRHGRPGRLRSGVRTRLGLVTLRVSPAPAGTTTWCGRRRCPRPSRRRSAGSGRPCAGAR